MRIGTLIPEQILNENRVYINRSEDNKGWTFIHNGKVIPQPEPHKCYQTLIDQFGIMEPRFKNWR